MSNIPNIGIIILFVESPYASRLFYEKLLKLQPIEASPTFVMFALSNGTMLGLWSRYTAEPRVEARAGCSEICLSEQEVDKLYEIWGSQGVVMAQKPTDMDFGRCFVALDPDGHRIRVYRLHENG